MTKALMAGAVVLGLTACTAARAQQEGMVPTQTLVAVRAKAAAPTGAGVLTVEVNGRKQPVSGWAPVSPQEMQVAVLIDDGLRESVGRNLSSLEAFLRGLPQGLEVMVGYMENGTVRQAQPFTADHEAAAAAIRLPEGVPGESASPYFCLSDFVKHWPGEDGGGSSSSGTVAGPQPGHGKARVVLMITNGVDPYNGSTSVMNQDSPYVAAAASDAQRAGVMVYSLYFTDAGIRGPSASLSGQSYLEQVTQATGGRNLYEGIGNLVDMGPFLKQFTAALGRTYIAGFDAPAGKNDRDLARVKFSSLKKTKLRAADQVRPGNVE